MVIGNLHADRIRTTMNERNEGNERILYFIQSENREAALYDMGAGKQPESSCTNFPWDG